MPSRARGAASRASTCLNNALDALFERRNPAFVIIYLVLFCLAFSGYTVLFFSLLPLPGAPFWHVYVVKGVCGLETRGAPCTPCNAMVLIHIPPLRSYTGSAAALASLALYVRACRSDPGVITRANVDRHSSSFARDGVLYSPRMCGTCHISKPARSKHCRICDRQVGGAGAGVLTKWYERPRMITRPSPPPYRCRCVARMDHHCFFINNCVGQCNHRLFLAFLASTASLCAYGALGFLKWVLRDLARPGCCDGGCIG